MNNKKSVPEILKTPPVFNMGFHYTQQYSRRSRIKVMGLVDQASPCWERWYNRMHEFESCRDIADAGYKLIEIHFLYGFGLKEEQEEYELTREMVKNAHNAGLKVLGYFQFFSVQSETFFLENPWAKHCIQVNEDGKKRQYAYNRDALCFSHEQVKQYYLDGIKLGLKYCGLDGVRMDNLYHKTCYCNACQKQFKQYLLNNFSELEARRIFGIFPLSECNLVPVSEPSDPLWQTMTNFGIDRMNEMMQLLYDQVKKINPEAIFGGNPAIYRSPDEIGIKNHVYPPELGMHHDLVCSENALFPSRTGDSIRHQALAYKTAQANGFKVYGCHHQHKDGKLRWPEKASECALSMFESLAFGGQVPVSVWGIRMDGNEYKTLYERPEYLEATKDVADFISAHGEIFLDAVNDAKLGIYVNRESLAFDYEHSWYSLQGLLQIFLKNHIPFRMVDTDDPDKLQGLTSLIIADVRPVSLMMFNTFLNFADRGGKILMTGEACCYDKFMLERDPNQLKTLDHLNIMRLNNTPEACNKDMVLLDSPNGPLIPYPEKADHILPAVKELCYDEFKITAPDFVAMETWRNALGQKVIALLNYDNVNLVEVIIQLPTGVFDIQIHSPKKFGVVSSKIECNQVKLSQLNTMTLISYQEKKQID